MKIIGTLAFLYIALSSFVPKGDKENFIEIKGKQVASFTKEQCLFGSCNKYEITDLNGKLLISIEMRDYYDPSRANSGNPKGRVAYYEWTFYETKTKVETDIFSGKKISEYFEKNKLFDENGISAQGVENFSLRYGRRFSEEKDTKSGSTIIINNR